jgi:hypothetical protein
VDGAGNVYVADSGNALVREVSAKNGYIYTIAGNWNQYPGYYGDGGPALYGQLEEPTGLSLDPSGNLYIADFNDSVVREVTNAAELPNEGPVIAPGTSIYPTLQTVSITPATNGATVYYTTDGSIPTTSSTKYTGSFALTKSEAITAFEAGTPNSTVTIADILYAAPPVFNPAAGQLTKATPVTITEANATATIYYTTDGSDPTGFGPTVKTYSGPITVTAPETVRAAALTSVKDYEGTTVEGFSEIDTAIYSAPAAPSKPSVAVTAATLIGANTATLHGTVIANNATTQYWWAYGTSSSALTNTTPKSGAFTGTATNGVSIAINALKASTKYYFELNATNSVGTSSSTVLSFTTSN